MKYSTLFVLLFWTTIGYAQSFYDLDSIQTIEVSFSQSNWDALMDAAYSGDGDYIMAESVSINGEVFDSVGVKYKGNSSYSSNQVKNPWHIELDTYKDHEYNGYTDIKLANGYNDPSFLRDVLGFYIIRKYMDAPLSNYANLYVNGTLIGLYTNTESVSKKFAKSRFGSNDNAYFDCSPPDGATVQSGDYPNLVYLGQDSSDYYDAYEMKSDEGWQELIDLCDTLDNNIDAIENILDVDRALWMLAFDNAIVNLDSYIGIFSQNYYLYRSDYRQFLPIVWDLNESFGVFSQTGSTTLSSTSAKQRMSYLLHSSDSDYPLIKQLLSIPMYKRMYLAHYKTILLENFDNDDYYETALALQDLIDESVQADNNKFYTYTNFQNNLTSDISTGYGPQSSTIPGITNLMDTRTSYLLALSDFTATQPAISAIALSDESPAVNDSIFVTASVSNGTTVYLGYRNAATAPFTRVQMYDDGLHADGSADDGTYGTGLKINYSETQYYIYAENDDAGMFSPERAQHEYYSISATSSDSNLGDLVINEFMASNETTATDQDGEYDDWIELYNNSSESIALDGYYLSDDGSELTQWAFPTDTFIAANSYLIVWADDDDDQSGLHANFKLSASGETLYLTNTAGSVLDSVAFPDQSDDISYGRYPNGTGDFESMSPTFAAENIVNADADSVIGDLVINEFMASNETTATDQDGEYDDWIELYNNSSESIALDGYYLSDDGSELTQWAFPTDTFIAANSYLIVWADDDDDQSGLHANFKLSASGETLYLATSSGSIIDSVIFADQSDDISYGRYPNGTGDFESMTPTFAAENSVATSTPTIAAASSNLSVYPNPFDDSFSLELDSNSSEETTVRIYSVNGTIVYQNTIYGSTIIDAAQWTPGMYFVQLNNEYLKILKK